LNSAHWHSGDALTVLIKNMSMTCLEKLIFSVGGVEVTLRNAVEINPDRMELEYSWPRFLSSAAWCAVDVQIASIPTVVATEEDFICVRTELLHGWIQ
jgi:hypothetical protein